MMDIKRNLKAVIFDMDGTIIRSENIWKDVIFDAIIDLAAQKNRILPSGYMQRYVSILGGDLVACLVEIEKDLNLGLKIEEFVPQIEKRAATAFASSKKLDFVDGFVEFHKRLQQNAIRTSLATNSGGEPLEVIISSLNIHRFFGPHIYNRFDVGGKAKPNPDLFLHAAKNLGVKSSEVVVFEDNEVGFEAAKAAGMKCVAVKHEINKNKLDKVDAVIENYFEAEGVLRNIFSEKGSTSFARE